MRKVLLTVVALASAMGASANTETLTERSQAKARDVLDAAVLAIGGAEALQGIAAVRLQLEGQTFTRLQMPTPTEPFDPGYFKETLTVDLKNNRLHLEQQNRGAGFEGHNAVVIKDGAGNNYDFRARTTTPIAAAQTTQQQFIQYYRRLPNLILQQALNNPNSLRYLGEDDFEGRKHNVITFVMPDTQQVALYIDASTNLVSKYELIFTDPLTGEDASEIIFADYAPAGALKAPRSWVWRLAGDTQARYSVKAEFNPTLTDKSFEVASNGFTAVQPPPQNLPASVDKLAEGVYVIRNVAGQNQNTLAVAFKDYILAVEAPGTSAGADSVIARIKETIPGKPIRYVAMTHHHGDHIGGLRSFIAEGATVVTTDTNRKVVDIMAAAPQKDRLAKAPKKVEFALLEKGRKTFTDGERTVELIDIGPNPHAKEMVVAWLPNEKIVFQGDLFFVPDNPVPQGPPQASTLAFARALEEKKLQPARIASVHGRTATIEEFRAATSAAAASGQK